MTIIKTVEFDFFARTPMIFFQLHVHLLLLIDILDFDNKK